MRIPPLLVFAAIAAVPSVTAAAPMEFSANLGTLNPTAQTGVQNAAQGTVDLTLDPDAGALTTHFRLTGLEPGQPHPRHIHGTFDAAGNPTDSNVPTLAQDTDGDNFIELQEGAATYGPVILDFGPLFADASGNFDEIELFDLTDSSVFGADPAGGSFGIDDLLPLDLRHVVVHGLTVPASVGIDAPGIDDEVDGTGGYKAVLPVANGEIVQVTAVPEPGTATLFLAGLFLLGLIARGRLARAGGRGPV